MATQEGNEFFAWARQEEISETVMQILISDGFGSRKGLSELTVAYVEEHVKGRITEGESIHLKMSIRRRSRRDANMSATVSSGHEEHGPPSASPPSSDPTSPPPSDTTSPPLSDPTSPPPSDPTSLPPSDPTSPPPSDTTSPPLSDPTSPPPSDTTSPPPTDPTSLPPSGPPLSDPTSRPALPPRPKLRKKIMPPSDPTSPPPSDPTSAPPSDPMSPPPSDPTSPSPSDHTPSPSDPTTPPPSDPTSPPPSDPTSPPPSDPASPPPSDPTSPPPSDPTSPLPLDHTPPPSDPTSPPPSDPTSPPPSDPTSPPPSDPASPSPSDPASPPLSDPTSGPPLPPRPYPSKKIMPVSPTVRVSSTTEDTRMSDKALEGRLSRATLDSSEKEFLPSDDTSIQLASPSSEPDPSQVWKSAPENTLGKDKTAEEDFQSQAASDCPSEVTLRHPKRDELQDKDSPTIDGAKAVPLASADASPDLHPLQPGDSEQISRQDVGAGEKFRFLLLGKSGCGKSATGNTILGDKKFARRASFGSVTDRCEAHGVKREKKTIEVMDCPGLYDTSKSHEDVATMIVQAVAFTHPGPHAILFVLSAISRYTEEEHRVFERVKALFDDDVTKYIIVLFTHGDDLEREDLTLEDLLKEAPDRLKELLKECNYRYVLFDNNARNKQSQVELLLQKVQKLVQENGGPYKCPKYQPVGEGLEKEIQRRVQEIEEQRPERKRLESELESTLKEAENRLKHMLQDFERIEEGKRDMKELQAAQNEVASRKRRKEAIEKEKEREYDEEMEKMRYDVALKPQEPSVKKFLKKRVGSLIRFLRGKKE